MASFSLCQFVSAIGCIFVWSRGSFLIVLTCFLLLGLRYHVVFAGIFEIEMGYPGFTLKWPITGCFDSFEVWSPSNICISILSNLVDYLARLNDQKHYSLLLLANRYIYREKWLYSFLRLVDRLLGKSSRLNSDILGTVQLTTLHPTIIVWQSHLVCTLAHLVYAWLLSIWCV